VAGGSSGHFETIAAVAVAFAIAAVVFIVAVAFVLGLSF
jgi:hypothetical protein